MRPILPIVDPGLFRELGSDELHGLAKAYAREYSHVVLRVKTCTKSEQYRWLRAFRDSRISVYFNGTIRWPFGRQIPIHRVRQSIQTPFWGTTVHNRMELMRALRFEPDWLLVAPVAPTLTHPGQGALSLHRIRSLVRQVRHRSPSVQLFALGGVRPEEADRWQKVGFDGVAAMRGCIPESVSGFVT